MREGGSHFDQSEGYTPTQLTILLLACSIGLLDGKLSFPEGAAQSSHHPPFHLMELKFQEGPQGRGNVFGIAEVVALRDAKMGREGREGRGRRGKGSKRGGEEGGEREGEEERRGGGGGRIKADKEVEKVISYA